MLTGDLIRARRSGDRLVPRYLRKKQAERALELARELTSIFSQSLGERRADVDTRLSAIAIPASERLLAAGLRKLLEERASYAVVSPLEPAEVRRVVFRAAARAHREMPIDARWDDASRAAVLADAAAVFGAPISATTLEAALYADHESEERLKRFDAIAPAELVDRYNLALAQGMLLRASRVVIDVRGATPARYRRLFRAARFHGLLHVVERTAVGYRITVDGPYSLFDSVQRYGLRLAMFLPHIIALGDFTLRADLVWGKTRTPAVFEVGASDGLTASGASLPAPPVDLDQLRAAFDALGSDWSARPCDRLFALPGEIVCVPDLVFDNRRTGEEVFLEVFGFWSRDAVFKRAELLAKGLPGRVMLAVPKSLRVSADIIDDDNAGEIVLFRSTLSARALLDRLESRGARDAPAAQR